MTKLEKLIDAFAQHVVECEDCQKVVMEDRHYPYLCRVGYAHFTVAAMARRMDLHDKRVKLA